MRKILLVLVIVLITCSANAAPMMVKSPVTAGSWTPLILIHEDKIGSVYIPQDMVNMNLFWTTYPDTGNFSFVLYVEMKDEALRKKVVEQIRQGIANNTVTTWGKPYPELLRYSAEWAFFDMQNRQVVISKEIYYDQDGDVIGDRDVKEITGLNEQHPYFSRLATVLAAIMEEEKNYPKNADLLKEMRQKK